MFDYKRLTDEELYDFLSRVFVQLNPTLTQQMMSCAKELLEYRSKIENGELAEAKHGKWIANEHTSRSETRGRMTHYATYKCSVCGKWNGRKKQKYCPNCGAKMDLEEQQ